MLRDRVAQRLGEAGLALFARLLCEPDKTGKVTHYLLVGNT